MSIAVYKLVWNLSESTGSDRLVLLCLAEHADDYGRCWPGIKTIARLTKVSERQVSRSLKKLDEKGEISYTPGDGRGNKSHYKILLKDDKVSSFSAEEKDDKSSIKDDTLSERMTNETKKDDTLSYRTVIEPSKNRKGSEKPAPDNAFWLIPENLRDETFVKIWSKWLDHVNAANLTFTEPQAAVKLAELSDIGLPVAINSVKTSLSRGWKNVYITDEGMNGHGKGGKTPKRVVVKDGDRELVYIDGKLQRGNDGHDKQPAN